MAVLGAVRLRQTGTQSPGVLSSATTWARAVSLLDASAEVVQSSPGMVKCLALDNVDERFLVSVDSNARVSLFDCAAPRPSAPAAHWKPIARHAADDPARRRRQGVPAIEGHAKMASAVTWFTGDTGLFVTGGFDGRVIAWDTARFEPAFAWALGLGGEGANVCGLATSRVAASHALVAVASGDARVKLIDLSTCSATHALGDGSGGSAVSVAWSPSHEYVLASGSADGVVRLWDVRRPGAAALLAVADPLAAPAPRADSSSGAAAPFGFGTSAASNPATAARGGIAGISHSGAVNAVHFAWAGGGGVPVGRMAPRPGGGLGAPLTAASCLLSFGSDSTLRAWAVQAGGAGLALAAALRIPRRPKGEAGESAGTAAAEADAAPPQPDPLTHEPLAAHVWPLPRAFAGLACKRALAVHIATAPYGRFANVVFTPSATAVGAGGLPLAGASAAGRGPGVIAVHALETGERMGELRGHSGPVNGVWYRAAAQELFSCGDDGLVLCWTPPLLKRGRALPAGDDGGMEDDVGMQHG